MSKYVMAVAFCGALAACATPQASTAQEQECVTQPEEATGSRVESTTVCPPEQPGNSAE